MLPRSLGLLEHLAHLAAGRHTVKRGRHIVRIAVLREAAAAPRGPGQFLRDAIAALA